MDIKKNHVEKQYTDWVYPAPIPDLKLAIDKGYWEYGTYEYFWPYFHPEGKKKKLSLLIAGCGSNQAAYQAYVNSGFEVTGIDLSENSLSHQQYLKDKHGLHNLTLRKLDILEIEKLGKKFDLIISTGVVHHMEDPLKGLCCLKNALTDDGFMNIMLYGSTLRYGVYLLQEVFRMLRLDQSENSIDIVKKTISLLSESHPLKRYMAFADDLYYNSGIVDTFLHKQDTAYSVPKLFKLINDANLSFWDWEDRVNYCPSALIPSEGNDLLDLIQKNDKEIQWAIMENLTFTRGTHRFYLTQKINLENKKRIQFNNSEYTNYIPMLRPGIKVMEKFKKQNEKSCAVLERNGHRFQLDVIGAKLMELVNSTRTIGEIEKMINLEGHEKCKNFWETMNEWGHLMFVFNKS